jgi:hypothetical protein
MAMMTQRRSWAWLLGTYALLSAIALGMLLPLTVAGEHRL